MPLVVSRARRLRGVVHAPPDKSISHRAVILASLAAGRSRISNYLDGDDNALTLEALSQLGVAFTRDEGEIIVEGVGAAGLAEAHEVLRTGRSAATMRFVAGLVAPEPHLTILSGVARTNERPMARIIDPLRAMGATVLGANGGTTPPLAVLGGSLRGVDWSLDIASAEAKTSIMLAALRAEGPTTVRTPLPCRDHTERLVQAMGVDVGRTDPTVVTLPGDRRDLLPLDFRVPGEMSVAVYWLVAGSVHPDADITITDVCMNPTRIGVLEALTSMGADISVVNETDGIEPVATLRVRSAQLHGTTITPDLVPRMIDEFPGFILAACLADGPTVIQGAEDLRNKKSNRLETVAQEYRKLGATIDVTSDGMTVAGGARLRGATTDSHGDHRLGNSLATAGLLAEGETVIENDGVIAATSYPAFIENLRRLAS
ncbi:3-phosphoshikimate 1-carboxyvinyltransferase [Nocardioides zeae]|uniref:3-phosphoshikimate 1-carboxyvinyltransferase n=1 Tax=Nocardioides zeae TaxID=1457234 RepID=A0A6P0HLG5_9ACTN|nr:3-phosphoshikimate 1-carboxyvinyltransferase [Nocardioides zeae]NEN79549.1 3-phosphoshikimate 1-carboxyvinyltransferase [Nocardioides zeae]